MPIENNAYTVPINFVDQYDGGQKKICANQVDENFNDAANAINALLAVMANAAMPSNNRIALSLPDSAGNVTAPDDGWMFLGGTTTSTVAGVSLYSSAHVAQNSQTSFQGSNIYASIPVAKNTVVVVNYTNITNAELIFIYANGFTTI